MSPATISAVTNSHFVVTSTVCLVEICPYTNMLRTLERCHTKTGLEIFVAVMPKEDFTGTNPAKASFGMTPFNGDPASLARDNILLCCLRRLYYVVGVIPKDLKICFLVTLVNMCLGGAVNSLCEIVCNL